MKSEVELAKKVIDYLHDQKWEVYQEVQPRRGKSSVADIVATQGKLVWIIECKLSYGLAVVEQAREWIGWAHYISVAAPVGKRNHVVLDEYLKSKSIGLISFNSCGDLSEYNFIRPRLNRKPALIDMLKSTLREEHKSFAEAGNNYGRRFTPFQATCDNIRRHLALNPGCTLKDLVASIQTHYHSAANARSSIYHWALNGSIAGVEARKEGCLIRMYLKEEE
jgi:hypothetical protein